MICCSKGKSSYKILKYCDSMNVKEKNCVHLLTFLCLTCKLNKDDTFGRKKGGPSLAHVNNALNISFFSVSALNVHIEDNTHLWSSALDRHLHLRIHYQRFV